MTRQETIQLKPTSGATPQSVDVSLPNAGRNYKNIKEALVDLPEITASIQAKTGWDVDISKVPLQVVTQQELNRRCLEDVAVRTGIPTTTSPSFVARTLSDALLSAFHKGVVALYLPSEGAIVINEDRLRGLSKDAVKSYLHHELTHAGQQQKYPAFMQSVDRLARELKLLVKHGGDVPADERSRRTKQFETKVQSRMSLIEGQAVALQKMYEKEFDLHPEIKIGPIEVALGLSSMLIPGMTGKMLQYVRGPELFKRIHALGTQSVDELFRDPKYTDLVFGPENPKKAKTAE